MAPPGNATELYQLRGFLENILLFECIFYSPNMKLTVYFYRTMDDFSHSPKALISHPQLTAHGSALRRAQLTVSARSLFTPSIS